MVPQTNAVGDRETKVGIVAVLAGSSNHAMVGESRRNCLWHNYLRRDFLGAASLVVASEWIWAFDERDAASFCGVPTKKGQRFLVADLCIFRLLAIALGRLGTGWSRSGSTTGW